LRNSVRWALNDRCLSGGIARNAYFGCAGVEDIMYVYIPSDNGGEMEGRTWLY
jgi:hypothetical protein